MDRRGSEQIQVKGFLIVRLVSPAYIRERRIANLLMNASLSRFVRALTGEDLGDKFIAVGSGKTPPNPTDIKLEDERGRKVATETAQTGSLEMRAVWSPSELVGVDISEAGVFWDGASPLPDSGILMCRSLLENLGVKTNSEILEIIWLWEFWK